MSTKLSKYLKYYLKCDTINSVWCKQTTTAAIKKPPSSRDIFFFKKDCRVKNYWAINMNELNFEFISSTMESCSVAFHEKKLHKL